MQSIEISAFYPLCFLTSLENNIGREGFYFHKDIKKVRIQITLIYVAKIDGGLLSNYF